MAGVVVDYDPAWVARYETLRDRLLPVLQGLISSVEHVGSTAVPGLAAKPIIDLDLVYERQEDLPEIVRRLALLGYSHEGDRGIEGRESFRTSDADPIRHHLYACRSGSLALRNHLAFRDHLRVHECDRESYAALKKRVAYLYETDPQAYVEAKSEFIQSILLRAGMPTVDLEQIGVMNSTVGRSER